MRRNVDLVDLEKYCKMRPWSQKSASIQRRTSPPKFLENRGSRIGVPGVMSRDSFGWSEAGGRESVVQAGKLTRNVQLCIYADFASG